MPARSKKIICVDCGKEKWNQSGDRCANCYNEYRRKTEDPKPCSTCDRKAVLIKRGMCPRCYKRWWNKENREHINQYNYEWNEANPERRNATQKRYTKTEKYRNNVTAKNHARLKRLNEAPGNGLTAKEWKSIKEAHGYACHYCGRVMKRLEIEHKTPLPRGGAHDPENIVPACMRCNRQKGTMTYEEFISKRGGG